MFRRAGSVVAVTLALGACSIGGADDEQAGQDLDALQERIVGETEAAVAALDGSGLTVERAAGIAEYCGMQPAPGVTYRAGGVISHSGDPADQVAAVRDALTPLGWDVETEAAEPSAYANLAQGELRLSVAVSRRRDEPGVSFGITGPCIEVEDSSYLDGDDRSIDLLSGSR